MVVAEVRRNGETPIEYLWEGIPATCVLDNYTSVAYFRFEINLKEQEMAEISLFNANKHKLSISVTRESN